MAIAGSRGDPELLLATVGATEVSVEVTAEPWLLPLDALVISAGPLGELGLLGGSVRRQRPDAPWHSLDAIRLTPDQPQVLALPPTSSDGLRWLVVASVREPAISAHREGPASSDTVARATENALRVAAARGAARIGVPLLGAGAAGLDPDLAARAVVRAARKTLTALGRSGPAGLVLIGRDEHAASVLRRAWDTPEAGPAAPPPRPARELSTSASEVLGYAAVLAERTPATRHTGALVLLAALVRAHNQSRNDVSGALLARLAERLGDGGETRVIARLGAALDVTELDVSAVVARQRAEVAAQSTDLGALLDRAEQTAVWLGFTTAVRNRHLLAAVVTDAAGLPPTALLSLALTADELRAELRAAIRQMLPDEASDGWDRLLGTDDSVDLAGGIHEDLVDPDASIPAERDRLDVATYVTMLATVVARSDTPLPLSIGLFGEWGSGKSYFMGLLRARVQGLSAAGDPYLRDIVQIGFNAWHYADTNLWASLGNEIFSQLAGPDAPIGERRDRLRAELAAKLQESRDVEADRNRARQETVRLSGALEDARHRRERSAVTLLRSVAASATLQAGLMRVWSRLGVRDEVERGQLLVAEVRGARDEATALRRVLRGRTGTAAAVGVAVALLLAAAAVVAPAEAAGWLARSGLATLTSVLAVCTFAVARVRTGLRLLRTVATEVRSTAEETVQKAVAEDLARVQRAEAEERAIQAQLDEVLVRIEELGRELAALTPGQRLYGFISDRAGSQVYRRELGLISTIRRDFEQLIDLMQEWRDADDRDGAPRPIDRIVLYIDDLDRCSPRQVVDVLQAVHLLLAMDLFVVVVGVDPRWLLHCLRQQYPSILSPETARSAELDARPSDPDQADWRTTPRDYLEKIFNIPFALPGLTPAGFERLIRGLATDHGVAQHIPSPVEAARPPVPVPAYPAGDDTEERPTTATGPAVGVEPGSEVAAIQGGSRPRARHLTTPELDMLAALGPLVRTPRQAKRLLNLYRVLRSTRDLTPTARFLGADAVPGEFQAVVMLLGILTAHPRLLNEIMATAPDPDAGIRGGLFHQPTSQSWPDLVLGLAPREHGDLWCNDVCADLTEPERLEWARLVARSAAATALVKLPDLAAFQAWAPHVARFSFLLSPLATPPAPPDP